MQPVVRDLADALSGSAGDTHTATQGCSLRRDNSTSSTTSTIILPTANPGKDVRRTEKAAARPLQRVTSETHRREAQLRDQDMSTRMIRHRFTIQPALHILQLPQPLQRDAQELNNTSKRTLKMSHGPPLEVDEIWMKTPRQGRVADKLTSISDSTLYGRKERIILATWGRIRHMLVTKHHLDDVASGANEPQEDSPLRCTAIALQ